ncbi:beta-ketoacyl synthase N-terminal-like domain-containing protein [Streptomyces sp. NPDC006175]|uniref:beta-ketoacyl synthase N-terminal-like domain-containing protein n=1 Tax=Streptomyces sp. NPDC006175 TaxID=3154471 RepID=UPI0033AA8A7F
MDFEPIAVVGRGCVLPGALDPDTFWENIAAGRATVSAAPADRWRLPRRWAMGSVDDHLDRTWTDVGGYVEGFESVFDPGGFRIPAERISSLDPLFRWVLYGVRQALTEAGRVGPLPRGGLVMGNLSYPTQTGAAFSEHVWLSAQRPPLRDALLTGEHRARPDARNRFSSGLPALVAARALGLGAGAWALDAACASSLYAVKLACDRLHDGTADLMVAGGVSRPDPLYLHVGFCGLSATSRTGRSRPFHRDADGLVHGEGAGFVALMRLSEARAAGLPVFGVIRGVGLSNDGRGSGLISPSEEGQVRAMRLAYAMAGVAPDSVSLVECHATGTPVGDAVEVRGMARVFGGRDDVPIGSAKSNVGHLLASAGVAGLLKVLGAMRAGVRPATLGADRPLDALAGTPLRVLTAPEEWTGPRRAAVSAFGFGGTNAHLVVDHAEDAPPASVPRSPRRATTAVRRPDEPSGGRAVAIVALGARVGDGTCVEDFRRAVLGGERRGPATEIAVELTGLCFPPSGLERTVRHQLLVLEAAREAARGVALPRERTMVVVGMGVDPEVARAGARWRVPYWLERAAGQGVKVPPAGPARDAFVPPMTAEGVVGSMPNLVASRISTQLDLAGPSFAVSAEEASGLVALEVAARAVRSGEADAALVGAADLSCEAVHRAALRELGGEGDPGDAAVVLVLKPLDAARRDGDTVVALLDEGATDEPDMVIGDGPGAAFDPASAFGRAHAASGLLSVAVAALALQHRAVPRPAGPADTGAVAHTARAVVTPMEGPSASVRLRAGDPRPWLRGPAPRLHVFSGADRGEVLAALDSGAESGAGPARLALVVGGGTVLSERKAAARRWLTEGGPRPADVLYRDGPVGGRTAFVYTNGSAAYPGMGHELALALPSLGEAVRDAHRAIGTRLRSGPEPERGVLGQIWAAAELSVLHTVFSREVLGLRPDAALGYSSGESAALVALGAWPDASELYEATRDSGLFTTELTGELRAVRRHWKRRGIQGSRWSSYLVSASLDVVRAELATEAAVHLMAVNAPGVCVIGGESRACAAVVARLGADRAIELDYDMAAHAPELAEVREVWREAHRRPTVDVPGVRFYSGATGQSYRATAERAAEALTAQGLGTIDFAATVEQAWADGVRVFVEHGPRRLCTGWIKRVLGDREHVAVALDSPEDTGLRQLCLAVAELVVAGVPVRADEVFARLAGASTDVPEPGPAVTVPVLASPCLPPLESVVTILPPAPELAPVPDGGPGRPPAAAAPPDRRPGHSAAPVVPPARESGGLTAPGDGVQRFRPAADSSGGPGVTGVRAAVARQSLRVAALHQEVMAGHTEAHQRFLRVSALAVTALTSAAPPDPGPVPVRRQRPAASPPDVQPPPAGAPRPGPAFDRAQLEYLASGEISALFGPRFAEQDGYAVQTRMPGPPMLFADRVTGIDAVPAALVLPDPVRTDGRIWTETDVLPDSWYLDSTGRMPAGLLIEAGQADLLLLSWLGVDLLNRGERAYRLLGCEVTFHGEPPRAGDTLCFEIHVDGHAEEGGVRLAFFHYDCYVDGELRLSVREGQAGFFTPAELAGSGGVRWDPAEHAPGDGLPLDPPAVRCGRTRFGTDRLRALGEGRPADCFGPGWEATAAHVRSPRLDEGRLRLLDEVTAFDPAGGPWGRGYLRAETALSPDDWFFAGHFENDPCMPGTLMLQGGLQAMAFYLTAMGFTVDRDGWRFEPVSGIPYRAMCRGQATPEGRRVVYEVFVRGVSAGPEPTLHADVLGSVDGTKAFLGRGMALRLVPDWPLDRWRHSGPPLVQAAGAPVPLPRLGGLAGHREEQPVAVAADGFPFDYASLLACAWGRPSEAFGSMYEPFDSTRRVARLPGPPYHFMSRISSVDGPQAGMREGSTVVAEYDVPAEAWYFEQSGGDTAPFAVLMEIALQPCGWLASYVGSALTTGMDLLFRNLDGSGTVTGEVTPATRTVRTRAELTRVSRSGDMIIESFRVSCTADGVPVLELSTVFGYFPPSAFEDQQGLAASADDRARLDEPCGRTVDLTARPARYCAGQPSLPGPMLLMLDRITGYWPDGGSAGLGRLRSEKDVRPDAWFFRAHFFQDPVQPGSLGLEAMCQLLQYHLIESGAADGVPHARFEPVLPGRETAWTYRGQITPANRLIRVDMDVVESGTDERGPYAVADASLWGDGTCIYRVRGLGMRVVSGTGRPPHTSPGLPPRADGPRH